MTIALYDLQMGRTKLVSVLLRFCRIATVHRLGERVRCWARLPLVGAPRRTPTASTAEKSSRPGETVGGDGYQNAPRDLAVNLFGGRLVAAGDNAPE